MTVYVCMYVCVCMWLYEANPSEAFDSVKSPVNRSQFDTMRSPSTSGKGKSGAKMDGRSLHIRIKHM